MSTPKTTTIEVIAEHLDQDPKEWGLEPDTVARLREDGSKFELEALDVDRMQWESTGARVKKVWTRLDCLRML